MRFVLASHNKGKLAEMQAILGELGVEVVMPSDVGVDVDVEETGTTFAENAALKANAIMAASGLPAIADDSGLCVDWLQGAPGVYSARYGGLDDDAARYRLLLFIQHPGVFVGLQSAEGAQRAGQNAHRVERPFAQRSERHLMVTLGAVIG